MDTATPNKYQFKQTDANYVPLSPLTFLERAASVYPLRIAVIHGDRRYTWQQSYTRCRQLASALRLRGIGEGDTVAIMGLNTPETFEAHFGVPMAGAVLNALNTRLDAKTIAYILQHGEAKAVLTDRALSATVQAALALLETPPFVIDIDDPLAETGDLIGEMNYEAFLQTGDAAFAWQLPADEWQAITLNYTSGTTGEPKGVVYHHRGAYLNAVGNVLAWSLAKHPVYLWTLPMFHCNGWCFPWTLAAVVGTNVCLRKVEVGAIYDAIISEGVSHYCGAPIVHNMLVNAPAELRAQKTQRVRGMVAASAPPAAILQALEENNFDITHVYGLTETYGPAVLCEWNEDWNVLPMEERARLNARQGVRYHVLEGLMVADPDTLEPVPFDGETIGEVFMRGNNVMMGYLKNRAATEKAFAGGWFHTGDLAVMHPDGYLEIKDRSKDIIISGGENISTIEVESALYRHPAVLEAAVVGKPDEKWGETPCAFLTLRPDAEAVCEADVIAFCRTQLAAFKIPRRVVFGPLPKTSTGKVQKMVLREYLKRLD
jgi:fatty-acyl-CoA synthase